MSDASNYADWISAWAAAFSAIAAVFATAAALRSANSARESLRQLEEAERRRAIREVATTASAVMVETGHLVTALETLGLELRSLAIFNGAFGGSKTRNDEKRLGDSKAEAEKLATDAKPFADGANLLRDSPLDDIDRVAIRLTAALTKARAMSADVANEVTATRARNAAALERQRGH